MRALLTPALLALALAGCGGGEREPRVVPLAAYAGEARLPETLGDLRVEPASDGAGVWIEQRLRAQDWQAVGGGIWTTLRALPDLGLPAVGTVTQELAGGGREWTLIPNVAGIDPTAVAPDSFGAGGASLYLALEPAATPPDELRYRVFVELAARVDGRSRAAVGRFSGDGFSLLPGGSVRVTATDLPAGRLEFQLVLVGAKHAGGEATLRVGEGEERRFPIDVEPRAHRVALDVTGSELLFALDGPPCVAAVLAPTIRPGGALPPQAARPPSFVVFLADTFRADSLAFYGGEDGLTPRARRLRRGERALPAPLLDRLVDPSVAGLAPVVTPPPPARRRRAHRVPAAGRDDARRGAAGGGLAHGRGDRRRLDLTRLRNGPGLRLVRRGPPPGSTTRSRASGASSTRTTGGRSSSSCRRSARTIPTR